MPTPNNNEKTILTGLLTRQRRVEGRQAAVPLRGTKLFNFIEIDGLLRCSS
jgi:hypothetical protein